MNAIQDLERMLKAAQQRTLASIAVYGLFLVGAFVAVSRGVLHGGNPGIFVGVLGVWIAAIAILPRETLPVSWPTTLPPAEQDRVDFLINELRGARWRATLVRLAYFALAALTLFALPRLGL